VLGTPHSPERGRFHSEIEALPRFPAPKYCPYSPSPISLLTGRQGVSQRVKNGSFSMDNGTIEAIARALTQGAHVILSNRASSRPDLRFSRWFLTAESSEPTPMASAVTATFGKRTFQRQGVPREKRVGRSKFPPTRVSSRTRKPRSPEAVPTKDARILRAEKKA
jgi:hypothetical protein